MVGWLAAVSRLTLVYVTNETDAKVVTDPITQGKNKDTKTKNLFKGSHYAAPGCNNDFMLKSRIYILNCP